MKTHKPKKLKSKTKHPKVLPYHLLMYVEDSSPKIKKFSTTKALGTFIDKFLKKYPDYASHSSGHWIDFSVTNVSGRVDFFTDGLEVE
jgi:hypothetical protein